MRLFFVLIFVSSVCLTRLASAQERDPAPAGTSATGRISGIVRAADTRRPVARAVIAVERVPDATNLSRTVSTDAAGRFTFDGVPAGAYLVIAMKPGVFLPTQAGETRQRRLGRIVQVTA